jgi:adenosylcobyric acid synthase
MLAGFVLNKFRGDAALLAPGPEDLERATGVPVLGVLPMRRDHGLPEEDGLFHQPPAHVHARARLRVAVVATLHISNLDEFLPLSQVPGVHVVWARSLAELHGADWIVLPGSKQVSGDLDWLRASGIAAAIQDHAAAGRPVLGICGGLQMLGRTLDDPEGVDGVPHGPIEGLGLLPIATRYAAPKRLRATALRFGSTAAPWTMLRDITAEGYEIRCGHTETLLPGTEVLRADDGQAIGWQSGPVLGVYAHGLLESAAVLRALFGAPVRSLDDSLDGLADFVGEHLGTDTLARLLIGE